MTRTTLRSSLVLLTAGIGLSLGHASTANAAYPAVLQLAAGTGDDDKGQDAGPGSEQGAAVALTVGEKQYVVSLYMSSDVSDEDGPWQCKCSAVLMDPIVGPVVVQDQVQLTKNGGNRPCNHPRIAAATSDYAVWTYGTNENNGNTRTYVQGINHKCELTTERLRISEDNNQNEGAPDIERTGDGYFTAGYLSTANNEKDASYAVGVKATMTGTELTLEKMWHTKVVAPSNIGRPAIVEAGPDRAFFCASQGNNRPPEDGVACGLLNTVTGEVIHSELIAKSDPGNNVYMGQPTVARLDSNTFAVQVLESNGLGKKNNIKGSNTPHLYAIKVSNNTFSQAAYLNSIGKYPTHSAICGGSYGEKGETYVAVMGASPTGLGQPSIQFVSYNLQFKADTNADNWTIGFYGDAGKLANLYGANPNTQGRDFLRCEGDVKNPGFGVNNGYMADVETFFLAPHSGNIPGEPKNAAFLSFVPGKVSKAIAPEAPKEQPKKGITPPAMTGDNNNNSDPDPDPDTTPGPDPIEEGDPSISVNGPQAGGCSVPAGGSSPANVALLALGVAGLLAARRRK